MSYHGGRSSLNTAVRIPELVHNIIGCLDKGDTATTARVNRQWSQIALPQLWISLESVWPIFCLIRPHKEGSIISVCVIVQETKSSVTHPAPVRGRRLSRRGLETIRVVHEFSSQLKVGDCNNLRIPRPANSLELITSPTFLEAFTPKRLGDHMDCH